MLPLRANGFLAYASIIATVLYYVVFRPLWASSEREPSVTERGLILGLLAGYVAHNLLVFDNLISYFLFISVIAMLHGEYARTEGRLAKVAIKPTYTAQIIAPVMLVALVAAVYFARAA